jgi:predicted nucleic-acid-binding Zn-ribbon protein
MNEHKCTRCGNVFQMPGPPQPKDILLTAQRHIPLESFTHVTCPKCGITELARERKFFGILSPRGLQILVGLFILGIIVATIYSW